VAALHTLKRNRNGDAKAAPAASAWKETGRSEMLR